LNKKKGISLIVEASPFMSILSAVRGIPIAVVQEDISLDEAGSTVSDVLDSRHDELDDAYAKIDQDSSDTVTANPNLSKDTVFCFEGGSILGILCSSTLEDCEFFHERLESVISEWKVFEIPPGATFSFVSEDKKILNASRVFEETQNR
jgi:hypothetical protein